MDPQNTQLRPWLLVVRRWGEELELVDSSTFEYITSIQWRMMVEIALSKMSGFNLIPFQLDRHLELSSIVLPPQPRASVSPAIVWGVKRLP